VLAFGRPRSGRGEATVGYPKARIVGLVECGAPRRTQMVLRSQHPDSALQELYGFLLVHHAIRDTSRTKPPLMPARTPTGSPSSARFASCAARSATRRDLPRQTRPRRAALIG
jgi:hypothetical protein